MLIFLKIIWELIDRNAESINEVFSSKLFRNIYSSTLYTLKRNHNSREQEPTDYLRFLSQKSIAAQDSISSLCPPFALCSKVRKNCNFE